MSVHHLIHASLPPRLALAASIVVAAPGTIAGILVAEDTGSFPTGTGTQVGIGSAILAVAYWLLRRSDAREDQARDALLKSKDEELARLRKQVEQLTSPRSPHTRSRRSDREDPT